MVELVRSVMRRHETDRGDCEGLWEKTEILETLLTYTFRNNLGTYYQR